MKVFSFTQKGANNKINNDAILVNGENIVSNPWIIKEQDKYSHFHESLDASLIALVADGLGSTFASQRAVDVYNEGFLDLIDLVGEQDIVYWIMQMFVKLEVMTSRDSAGDIMKATSGTSIAGVIMHKFAGAFIFHAGDSKVFAVKSNIAYQITKDHFYGNVLENCACAGGGHYISIEGARRNKNTSFFVATNSFFEVLSQKCGDVEKALLKIMNKNGSEESIEEIKALMKDSPDNVSAIGIIIDK